jgi:hypothetical protein
MDDSKTLLLPRLARAPELDAQAAVAVGVPAAASNAGPETGAVGISVIMPTPFWAGPFERCARRVLTLLAQAEIPVEAIFVYDAAAMPIPAWLSSRGARVVFTGRRSGPAVARNLAARSARGRILLFVDADVELSEDAIVRVHEAFLADPDMVGIFGAYDDEPAAESTVSSFRNLLHHHTHSANPGSATSFWSGCGAIRAAEFLDIGGFQEGYNCPCVEDIELGMRIAAQGGRIVLDPRLNGKHLKRWTLASMVYTDIVHRAVPWTRLLAGSRQLPAALNLDWRSRLSGICAVVFAACVMAVPFQPAAAWGVLGFGLGLLALNLDFYTLCLQKRGPRFAAASFALHTLYFVYSTITFGVVFVHGLWSGAGREQACPSPRFDPLPHGVSAAQPAPGAAR